jgi:hypothetical protein
LIGKAGEKLLRNYREWESIEQLRKGSAVRFVGMVWFLLPGHA